MGEGAKGVQWADPFLGGFKYRNGGMRLDKLLEAMQMVWQKKCITTTLVTYFN
ncbi:hypothetical protein HOLleu_06907 [Holothuria leucospilota]|uniref:Uncharacterized protein n=1 Tax=Holothuria leucospilota TaxID=206669 RepID=A0A9Q1HJV9_HOLLE|nr:hypothetical protein HOLleu_06907 [Holothuria leucospilota]